MNWVSGIIAVGPDDVAAAAAAGVTRLPPDCEHAQRVRDRRRAARTWTSWPPRSGNRFTCSRASRSHCGAGRWFSYPTANCTRLPVAPPSGITIYSGAWGKSYKPSETQCAESIAAGLVGPIDVPRVIETAYRDGVRAFVEVGPGNSCARMIAAILGTPALRPRRPCSAPGRGFANPAIGRAPRGRAPAGRSRRALRHRNEMRRPPRTGPRTAKQVVIPVGLQPVVREVPRKVPAREARIREAPAKASAAPALPVVEVKEVVPDVVVRECAAPLAPAVGPLIESARACKR